MNTDSTTRLYLIRHGETEENRRGILVGGADVPLNDTGRAQALALAPLARSLTVDAIFASPLQRAVETAILAFGVQARIVTDSSLKEVNFGEWEGLYFAEIQGRWPELWQNWLDDWENTKIPGAEDFRAFTGRLIGFCDEIVRTHPGGRLAIVAHGGCIRAVLSHYLAGAAGAGFWKFKVENATLSELEFAGGFPILARFNQRHGDGERL